MPGGAARIVCDSGSSSDPFFDSDLATRDRYLVRHLASETAPRSVHVYLKTPGDGNRVQCRAATLERQALLGTAGPAPRGAIVRRPSDGKLLQHFGVDEKATNKHTKKTRKNTRKKHGRCPILPDDDCSGLTQARLDANPLLSTRGAL